MRRQTMEDKLGGTQLPPIRAYPAGQARAQALVTSSPGSSSSLCCLAWTDLSELLGKELLEMAWQI